MLYCVNFRYSDSFYVCLLTTLRAVVRIHLEQEWRVDVAYSEKADDPRLEMTQEQL